jgi:hypothetical protein
MRLPEQVLSYFCTILLKLDDNVKGPYITQESLAAVMIGINVPLGAYFVYDISADVREHFATLKEEGIMQPGGQSSQKLIKTFQILSSDGEQGMPHQSSLEECVAVFTFCACV